MEGILFLIERLLMSTACKRGLVMCCILSLVNFLTGSASLEGRVLCVLFVVVIMVLLAVSRYVSFLRVNLVRSDEWMHRYLRRLVP